MGKDKDDDDEIPPYKENPAKDVQEHVQEIDRQLWELEQGDDK